jgi:C-terminal processing protease CtpA/Prc
MRTMFGLVGLLVAIGVIVAMWSVNHPADTVRQAEPAKRTVEQLAGVDADGMRAKDSIRLDPVVKDGKLRYVLVDSIMAGGPMEKYFGLKRNDSIVSACNIDFRDQDGEMAIELIMRAYQTKAPLIVQRDGKRIQLPLPAGQDTTPAGRENSSPIHKQLDAIPGIR